MLDGVDVVTVGMVDEDSQRMIGVVLVLFPLFPPPTASTLNEYPASVSFPISMFALPFARSSGERAIVFQSCQVLGSVPVFPR